MKTSEIWTCACHGDDSLNCPKQSKNVIPSILPTNPSNNHPRILSKTHKSSNHKSSNYRYSEESYHILILILPKNHESKPLTFDISLLLVFSHLGRVEFAALFNVWWRNVKATPPNLYLIRTVLLHRLLGIRDGRHWENSKFDPSWFSYRSCVLPLNQVEEWMDIIWLLDIKATIPGADTVFRLKNIDHHYSQGPNADVKTSA